jgi:hypothetical protein
MLGFQRDVAFLPEPPSAHCCAIWQMKTYEKVEVENRWVGCRSGHTVGIVVQTSLFWSR